MDISDNSIDGQKKENESVSVDDLILEHWSSIIEIDDENNGHVIQTLKARVKYGRVREKLISLFSDKPTGLEDMGLMINDLNTGEELTPEVIIDDPKYKWIKIPFKYPIEKDEEFGFEARYLQPKTYRAIGEDYYSYTSRHDSKDILIKIKFPSEVRIKDIDGSNIKTSGGIILDLPKDNRPVITTEEGKACIVWAIKYGKIGYTYTVRWRTEKIDE
ncbi:MAG: hypothetical protein JSV56_07655 [Methanomassiliicoccales archaeon]|nr:MAG: hypothetical protein JSV56_07655 [Methanomassiliicoccales archaeon]